MRSRPDRLEATLRPFCEPTWLHRDWQAVRIERWSLATVGAPILPDDRFWIAVALSLRIAIVATAAALPFGLAIGWLLARTPEPLEETGRALASATGGEVFALAADTSVEADLARVFSKGIGVSNVRERLEGQGVEIAATSPARTISSTAAMASWSCTSPTVPIRRI